jgi:peroxiredoxin Q/BCP
MLKPGDAMPDFSLLDERGEVVTRSGLRGRRFLLYLYPKDDTPGCTREACAFRDAMPAFGKLGVPVYGLSADAVERHRKFAGKYDLNFPLLSDPDLSLVKTLGAWVEKSLYGRKYFGIARCTFLVGPRGRIEQVWEKVAPDTHAEEVRRWLAGETVPAAAKPAASPAARAAPKAAAKKAPARATATPAAKPAARKAAARPPTGRVQGKGKPGPAGKR